MGTLSALRLRLCVSGLVALTLVAYARVWTLGWVYDDVAWLPMTTMDWAHLARWPYRVGAWVSGELPWGTHGIVLALHLVNGGLLWRIARRWLSPVGSVVTLALFWLHPINSQAVAYASGGVEVLLTAYVLLAWLGLTSGASLGWIAGAVCLGLALSLKVSALPLLLLVLVAAASTRGWSWRGGALALGAGLAGAWMYLPSVWSYWTHGTRAFDQFAVVCVSIAAYLGMVGWPMGFSVVHEWHLASSAAQTAAVSGVLGSGLVLIAVRAWTPFAAWAWIVGLLAPRALAPDMPPLTEHHTYLPFISIWLLAGTYADQSKERYA